MKRCGCTTGRTRPPPAVDVIEAAATAGSWAEAAEPEAVGEVDAVPAGDGPAGGLPVDALRIGAMVEGGGPVDLPVNALPTHVAIVGAAGGGKTWMAKVVAEEAIRLGIPVLAVDPQGDLVQFLRPAPEQEGLDAAGLALRRAFLDRAVPRA